MLQEDKQANRRHQSDYNSQHLLITKFLSKN